MTLDEFEAQLAKLIGRPTDLRPFVCDGSPLDCKIFLVGFNPATELEADFWTFWRTGYGYDKAPWFARYLVERTAKPLKPGKKFRPKISPTRRNIDHFVAGAGGVPVLETNIYSKASEDERSLDLADRRIAPFRFLLDVIKPSVIVVHGKPAREAMGAFKPMAKILEAEHHFSRKTSKETAAGYGALAAKASSLP